MDASHDMSPQWFTSPAKLSVVARTTYTQNSLFSLTKKTLLPCIDPSEQGHLSADKRSEQQTMSHCTALQEKQMSHTKCKGWRFAHSDSTNVNDKNHQQQHFGWPELGCCLRANNQMMLQLLLWHQFALFATVEIGLW